VDEAALLESPNSNPDTPFLNVSPLSLNFGNNETSLSLSMVNGDSGELSVTSVDDDATWLTVTANAVDATTQLGSYQITVDRTELATGTYTANITIVSSANSVTVPVIQQVGGAGISTDAGYQYVLLLNADNGIQSSNGQAVLKMDVTISSSTTLTSLLSKNYLIITGTDQNNDNIICDAGEACGAYITQIQPKTIAADDPHSDLDFTTGFNVGLQNQRLSTTTGPLRGIAIRRLPDKQTP